MFSISELFINSPVTIWSYINTTEMNSSFLSFATPYNSYSSSTEEEKDFFCQLNLYCSDLNDSSNTDEELKTAHIRAVSLNSSRSILSALEIKPDGKGPSSCYGWPEVHQRGTPQSSF